ncbi:hypothetical protein CsSME_00029110 [Camellia sinensis var. sinensis]
MRPIFCGNFEYDARQSDLERLFRKYGKVDRVDMKSVRKVPNICPFKAHSYELGHKFDLTWSSIDV